MTLSVTHLGDEPAVYEPALHPYFQVADARNVRISGLDYMPFCDYSTRPVAEPELVFTEQGIDRVYACSSAVTIHDDGDNRDIVLNAPSAASRIIWNPGTQLESTVRFRRGRALSLRAGQGVLAHLQAKRPGMRAFGPDAYNKEPEHARYRRRIRLDPAQ
jgi:hypothetical protein